MSEKEHLRKFKVPSYTHKCYTRKFLEIQVRLPHSDSMSTIWHVTVTAWKALKCKPSANCACAILLIGGLGYSMRLPVVACSSRRVLHGVATVIDSMRESIHDLPCDFLSPQGTQSERIFSLVFTAYLSNAVASGKSPIRFSGSRSSESAGITNRPPRSL